MTLVMRPELIHRLRDELLSAQGGLGLAADLVHPPDAGPLAPGAAAALDQLVTWIRGFTDRLGEVAAALDTTARLVDAADGRVDVALEILAMVVLS